jgi:hypothetical protein
MVLSTASPAAVWDAVRDIGALHTRLVPGFVVATEIIPAGRRVTFANGVVIDEISSNSHAGVLASLVCGSVVSAVRREKKLTIRPNSSIAAMFSTKLSKVKCGLDLQADSGTTK